MAGKRRYIKQIFGIACTQRKNLASPRKSDMQDFFGCFWVYGGRLNVLYGWPRALFKKCLRNRANLLENRERALLKRFKDGV